MALLSRGPSRIYTTSRYATRAYGINRIRPIGYGAPSLKVDDLAIQFKWQLQKTHIEQEVAPGPEALVRSPALVGSLHSPARAVSCRSSPRFVLFNAVNRRPALLQPCFDFDRERRKLPSVVNSLAEVHPHLGDLTGEGGILDEKR